MGRPRNPVPRSTVTLPLPTSQLESLRRLAKASTSAGHPCTYGELVRRAVERYLADQLDAPLFAAPQRSLPMVVCPPIGGRRCSL